MTDWATEKARKWLEDWFHHELYYVPESVASLAAEFDAVRAALRLAVEALEKITNKHQSYDENGGGQYGSGITDGHRCAAADARAALAKIEALMATEEPAK